METKFYFLLIALFAFTFSAGAQKFGNDIVIHECAGIYWAKPKISVADNGWIYVLMNKYGHPSENDETRIYRSTDGGVTFSQIMHGITPSDKKQGGRDIVVTGDNASNIKLWYVYADNNTATGEAHVFLIKMDADGSNESVAHSYTIASSENHDVAISTNARNPDDTWLPFTIGFAASSNYNTTGYIDYVYSVNGGTTFNRTVMYNKPNSEFGSIDLSIGQATAYLYYPYVGIVFEMDKESEKNIGFIAGRADGLNSTTALQVNKKYSSSHKTKQPKIQWLCNNTLAEPYNFMIVYSNYYNDNDWDIIKIYPESGYNLSNHTLDNLDYYYVAGSSDSHEEYADLSYDKTYNHYLLTYRKTTGDESKVVYQVQHYTEALGDNGWTYIVDVSSDNSGTLSYYSPVVDIDLTRGKACYAFEAYTYGTTRLLFDSEWSNIGVEEVVMDGEFKVFPNPATDNITLRMNEEGTYLVRIYNMIGGKVATFEFTGTEFTHNISGLPTGMYLIKLNTEKGTEFTTKVIIK